MTDMPMDMTDSDNGAGATSERMALCIATYLRPKGLARLLDALDSLEPADGVTMSVVVVDNDPEQSAAWVKGRVIAGSEVHYAPEASRGITFARNRALKAAAELGVDWIGWLDDDEAPRPDWLQSIVATQRRSGADVVAGPSEPRFESDAKDWITDTGSYGTERFPTDSHYPYFHTRTSGVILRSAVVPEEGFDDRLALIGGEDRLFFTRIHRAGGSFVWDDDAIVDEWVPTSRVSLRWLAKRWFRTGVTRSLTMLYLDTPGLPRRLRRVAGGSLMAGKGIIGVLLAAPGGRTSILEAGRQVLLGAGAAWGAMGFGFQEYRKIHGT